MYGDAKMGRRGDGERALKYTTAKLRALCVSGVKIDETA